MRPTIEYAATVWDPTSQSKIKALENIQRRAARFGTNNYTDRTPGCVTNMITPLGWQRLEQRRQNSRLCMLYKIQHNLIDINRDLYIRHSDSRTRGQQRLFQERTNNETYRNSFFQQTVRDWNLLPASTVAAATIDELRANLRVSPASCRVDMDPMYIILIVKIWNVLDVNRLGDYICMCLTRVALTELETVGNDSCSIPEEEKEEEELE